MSEPKARWLHAAQASAAVVDRPQMRRGDSAYYKRLAAMRKNRRGAPRKNAS
jgi:hypothetical protein